jgi:hypothetical protein
MSPLPDSFSNPRHKDHKHSRPGNGHDTAGAPHAEQEVGAGVIDLGEERHRHCFRRLKGNSICTAFFLNASSFASTSASCFSKR